MDRQRKWVCVVRSAKARPTHRARSWCVVVAHEAYCSCAALLRRATPRQMCTAQQKPNDADGMMRLLPTTGRHISFPSISHCNFRPAQPPSNPPVMHAPALCTHSTQYYYQYNLLVLRGHRAAYTLMRRLPSAHHCTPDRPSACQEAAQTHGKSPYMIRIFSS